MRRSLFGYLVIVAASALMAYGLHIYAWRDYASVQAQYAAKAASESHIGAQRVDLALTSIYDHLRTIAALPGIRGAGRHADSIDPQTRAMVQQVYNSFAAGVPVSEIYVVPESLSPDQLDPVTGEPEAPIIMFDQLILNAGAGLSRTARVRAPESVVQAPKAGPEEVEVEEYRALVEQMTWLKARFPRLDRINGMHVPFLSSPEVITCDNTAFITTHADRDRSGVVFSVPFYGPDGAFKGTISAVMLSSALRSLLPDDTYVLVNPGLGYSTSLRAPAPHMAAARPYITKGEPDPRLIASTVVPVGAAEAATPWLVWHGIDNQVFAHSAEVDSILNLQFSAYCLVLGLSLAALLIWAVVSRDFARTAAMNASLAKARDEAVKAESEARAMAEEVSAMNTHMAGLNRELQANMERLTEAQNEIIKKGKLAHLGQLTATVAHEIRNPLAAVRTSAFLLKRKTKDKDLGIAPQIERIENGIMRCDAIITQLLDFARNSAAQTTPQKLDDWLVQVVGEEAKSLPAAVAIECDLGCGEAVASFDPARMQRAVINLLSNASEALVGRGDDPSKFATISPKVTIASRLSARGFEIDIADNGPGIPPDVLAKIFEPLFTTKSFGTGLGIPAVEKIMEQHGGKLEVKTSPGAGACFTLVFPGHAQSGRAA